MKSHGQQVTQSLAQTLRQRVDWKRDEPGGQGQAPTGHGETAGGSKGAARGTGKERGKRMRGAKEQELTRRVQERQGVGGMRPGTALAPSTALEFQFCHLFVA